MMRVLKHILWCALLFLPGLVRALSLEEAVAMGKARSLLMQDPRIEHQRVKGQIAEAWSNALPQVGGQVGYQRAWKAAKIFFPNPETGEYMTLKFQQDNAVQADVTLNQPLMTFGRIAAGLRAAYSAKRANDHMFSNTDRSVELEVVKRFWTVLLMREVVEARRASLAISDSSLANAERLRSVGMMSDYDVLRVRVQAMNQRPPLQQAENSLRLAELSLKELLGVPLDTAITADGKLSEYSIILDTANAHQAVMSRDDLEALRALAAVQKNVYVIYRNSYLPTLGGQVKWSWQWQNDEWAINPRNNLTSLYGGLALQIPIWTSGADWGRARQYRAEWRRAELNVQKAERGASLQYESATRSYRTALANEEAASLTVTQAQRARELAQVKFEQGQITPLEMDAAQLDELVAKVAQAQAKYDRLVAGAEARMALGLSPYMR